MKTLLDLANRMNRLAERIPLAANEAAIEITRAIHGDLLTVTPVDVSKALSNWVVTAEEPWAVDIDAYVEGEHGSTQRASIVEGLLQAIQQYDRKRPGQPLFITNNAPYIRLLNNGSSTQAPAGFVERSVLIGRKIAERLRLNLNG